MKAASDIQGLLKQRYFRKGETSWGDVAHRVGEFLGDGDKHLAQNIQSVISQKLFIPSSPVLMNAGAHTPMMCSCFVLPVEDSIAGIMCSLKDTMMIQKYGGGVGINFSAIRPEGSTVSTTGGSASGPVSFMGFWNEGMNVIRQGGRRQGAMMGVLNVDHPDLGLLLQAKEAEGRLTNFNLSVGLTEEFMDKVETTTSARATLLSIARHAHSNGEPGILFLDNINKDNRFGIPIEATNPCWTREALVWTVRGPVTIGHLADMGEDVQVLTRLKNGKLAFRTMRNPRQTGVSQVVALTLSNGAVLKVTPNHKLVLMNGTQKEVKDLVPDDRLSSAYRHWANGTDYAMLSSESKAPLVVSVEYLPQTEPVYNGTVDETHTYFVFAGNFGEAVLSANCGEVPLPPYGACCLGSINLLECMFKNEDKWEFSFTKLRRAAQWGATILNKVLDLSWWPLPEIADFELKYRPIGLGVMGLADVLALSLLPYGSYEALAMVRKIMQTIREEASAMYDNTTYMSIAPTGSIAMLAGCSYSIEPYFSLSYTKKVEAGDFEFDNWIVNAVAEASGYTLTERDKTCIKNTGSVAETDAPLWMKRVLKTANEITPAAHLIMQAAVQKEVDCAVSKTINLPQSATVEEVFNIILSAHDLGLKGLTVYRSKSREKEVISCSTGSCDL